MKEGDHEHQAFINFAVDNGLDLKVHPFHLLYFNTNTHEFLQAFQAGYQSGLDRGDHRCQGIIEKCEKCPASNCVWSNEYKTE